jgi:hypothetical protein
VIERQRAARRALEAREARERRGVLAAPMPMASAREAIAALAADAAELLVDAGFLPVDAALLHPSDPVDREAARAQASALARDADGRTLPDHDPVRLAAEVCWQARLALEGLEAGLAGAACLAAMRVVDLSDVLAFRLALEKPASDALRTRAGRRRRRRVPKEVEDLVLERVDRELRDAPRGAGIGILTAAAEELGLAGESRDKQLARRLRRWRQARAIGTH